MNEPTGSARAPTLSAFGDRTRALPPRPEGAERRILVVDDDERLARVLALTLEAEGFEVSVARSAEDALARLAEVRPGFVLTDLCLPGMDGVALLALVQQRSPGLPVALLTGHGDIPEAVRATHAGAVDFLSKPVERARLLEVVRRHLGEAADSAGFAPEFVTRNPRLRDLLGHARHAAPTDASVLITGESGTGKAALAAAIHEASPRRARPLVTVNCAAVEAATIDATLEALRDGAPGTVFLREVGELPAELQARLVAAPAHVRLLSGTCVDLGLHVAEGRFREDLLYRLNAVQLPLPTLAERREDVPLLVAYRLEQLAAAGAPRRVYSPDAMEAMASAAWPGNVRQLFNVVEQNAALSPGRVISTALVQRSLGQVRGGLPSFDEARADFVRSYLRQVLEMVDGNISRAARLAGRNRTDLYKLMRRHGIEPRSFKRPDGADASRQPAAHS